MTGATLMTAAVAAWSAAASANEVTERFSAQSADAAKTVDHGVWDALLKKYVLPDNGGLNSVRYRAFKEADHATLKSYVAALENQRVSD